MKLSETKKHIIDCSLAFAISFLSLFVAMDVITLKIIIIAFSSSLLVALIKFREYWTKKVLGEKTPAHTIFF